MARFWRRQIGLDRVSTLTPKGSTNRLFLPSLLRSDLDLPQNVRDGFTQARTSLKETVDRVKASEARIDSELEPFIKKNYW